MRVSVGSPANDCTTHAEPSLWYRCFLPLLCRWEAVKYNHFYRLYPPDDTFFFFTACRSLRPATIIKLQTCSCWTWQRESENKSYFTRHQRFIPAHLLMLSSVYLRWWSGRPEALNHTHDRACGAGLFSARLCELCAAKTKTKTKQTYHVLLFLQVTPTCTPAPDPVSLCTQSAIVLINNEGRSCLWLSFFFF